jgi:spermidine/putrescine transport system permease protein
MEGQHMSATARRSRVPMILSVILAFYVLVLYGPVALLPVFSFNDNIYAVFPLTQFTTKWYQQLTDNQAMLSALWASIKIAMASAVIATILGFLVAKAMTRYRVPAKNFFYTVFMLPLILPTIIKGASLLSFFRQYLDIPLSLWTIGAAHVTVTIPFAMLILIARLESFDRSLEEASSDLGMNAWETAWRITLPLAMPGIIASLLLCFIVSFDEFMLAFFLSGNQPTLPIYMFGLLRFPESMPMMLALGSCILFFSIIAVTITEMLRLKRSEALL